MSTTPTNKSHDLVRCDSCGRYGWHETDRCPDRRHDVPLPAGADESSGDWLPADLFYPLPYRIVYCHLRDIGGEDLCVEGSAIQLADGRIVGEVEPPNVRIAWSPEMFSTAVARKLAAALLEVADELDGWARA
jgi:hypothetical protein